MMFYFIGLGLGDAKDITVKGLEIVKKSKRVYLEAYTSILTVGKEKLEEFYGRKVILADRDMVETQSDEMFEGSDTEDVSFLVVGDPFGATTHTDLVLRAKEKDLEYRVIHNASIMNAVGCCGLQLYNFGETISIVFWTDTWRPDSFYDKIKRNRDLGMHTLCLLDIKVKEQSIENLMKGKKIFEPPRYMSVNTAAEQLVEIIQRKKEEGEKDLAFTEDTICIGLARIGSETQTIVAATFTDMMTVDIGAPLHSFVIPGELHPLEKDMLKLFAYNDDVKQLLNS
ncbi:diphthine methyl ester synthase-like [Mytilus trossulus]|uniref:diphthine methyl ester synthase-like n=1 Tax=Mytilus trossulus TaxID=6551 RepID=UPI003006CFBC